MTYQALSFDGFGRGLNLNDKEDAVQPDECIDALNVEFTDRGAVRQRSGYEVFTDAPLTNRGTSATTYKNLAGDNHLIVGAGSRVDVLDGSSDTVDSLTGMTAGGFWSFAKYGAPGRELVFAGNGYDKIRQWDGTDWDYPTDYGVSPATPRTTVPNGGALAALSVDQGNRLLVGRFLTSDGGPDGSANSSNPSRVWYSEAGDPSSWPEDNWVDFAPGDGEAIQAMVTWNQFIFVFKESKFFVIYGTYDDNGVAALQWRTVEAGVGAVGPGAVCASVDGVYFVDQKGVYRTTGDTPELISQQISPIFDRNKTPSIYWTGGTLAHPNAEDIRICAHNRRVYIAFPDGNNVDEVDGVVNNRVLVYDPMYGWWTIWSFRNPAGTLEVGAGFMVSWSAGSIPKLYFGFSTGAKDIGVIQRAAVSDAGAAIAARWRSGWFNFDSSTLKTIRESKLWASGSCDVGIATDFESSAGTRDSFVFPGGVDDVWGGTIWGGGHWSNRLGLFPQLRRRAIQGTVFSTTIQNNSETGGFSIHRLSHHLREFRIPSTTRRTQS